MKRMLLVAATVGLVFAGARGHAQQLQTCIAEDGSWGYWDSASNSCIGSQPWPDQPSSEPEDGQLGACGFVDDGCSYVCYVYSRADHQYHGPAVPVQDYCK